MRYQTPQFIEEEEKLFGPLTFKQFAYIIGGIGISFVAYKLLPLIIAILVIIPVLVFSLSLAFYRVNDRPFIDTVEAAFYYMFANKIYTYRKVEKTAEKPLLIKNNAPQPLIQPKVSGSKLKDLAWSLDINEKIGGVNLGDNNK